MKTPLSSKPAGPLVCTEIISIHDPNGRYSKARITVDQEGDILTACLVDAPEVRRPNRFFTFNCDHLFGYEASTTPTSAHLKESGKDL